MKGWYTSNGGLLGCRNAKQQLRRNNESCHYKYTRWLQQHRSLVRGRRGNRVNNDKVCTTSKPQTFRHYCLTQFAMTCFWTTSVVYCSLYVYELFFSQIIWLEVRTCRKTGVMTPILRRLKSHAWNLFKTV